jgi:EAL domain-containing protein (putative c-di-GMP-specific phosphodiesterase class I)/PAS domain-containing protein
MSEVPRNDPDRPRFGHVLQVLLPALFTLVLIVMLLFTMFFTEFDRQWLTFLAGILFASVLALASTSLQTGLRAARRGAEAANLKDRLSVEIEQHRGTREQLERELALHQQVRTRLAKEDEAHRLVASGKLAAENMLLTLGLHLAEIAVLVDRDRRCRFHTQRFSVWTGVPSEHINGLAFDEALPPRDAEALRAPLLDALGGRAGQAEVSLARRDGAVQRVLVNYLPQRDAAGQVSGALVLIREAQASAAATASDIDVSAAGAAQRAASKLVTGDESGNAVYLSSLTEELAGWGDPRERIRQAIQSDGFALYAQDIVALRTDAAPKLMHELLIRMRDEEQNLVPPGTFLPIAERFDMMPAIDRFVVRKAIAARAAAARLSANATDYPLLCINLARASIEDRSFPEFVVRALEQTGTPGQALCFEIADSDAIACLPEASRFAHVLKPLGCRFTLDGFGRSGVGFDHVKSLPLDFLKIDGSIILQIVRVPEALSKVRAIQRVCKVIGIRTVAEMVESDECQESLRAVDVDYVQGFGIAKPRPFS